MYDPTRADAQTYMYIGVTEQIWRVDKISILLTSDCRISKAVRYWVKKYCGTILQKYLGIIKGVYTIYCHL